MPTQEISNTPLDHAEDVTVTQVVPGGFPIIDPVPTNREMQTRILDDSEWNDAPRYTDAAVNRIKQQLEEAMLRQEFLLGTLQEGAHDIERLLEQNNVQGAKDRVQQLSIVAKGVRTALCPITIPLRNILDDDDLPLLYFDELEEEVGSSHTSAS